MSELYQVEGKTYTLAEIEQIAIKTIKEGDYKEGMTDALSYLSQLFDGVEDTDLWADYMKEGDNE